MVTNSNGNSEFDALSNCSFVGFNLTMFVAYNISLYQSFAKNEANYIILA